MTWRWLARARGNKAAAREKTVEELALELARAALPKGSHTGHEIAAASFLVRASHVVALYPEKAVQFHRENREKPT